MKSCTSAALFARRIIVLIAASSTIIAAGCSGQALPVAQNGSTTLSEHAGQGTIHDGAQPIAPVAVVSSTDVVAEPFTMKSAKTLGAATSGTRLDLTITLRYRNESALDQLVVAQQTPGSGLYRHWLSNAEFNNKFAPTEDAYRVVIDSLKAARFTIRSTSTNRTVLGVSGSIAAIKAFFGVDEMRVRHPLYGSGIVNVTPAVAPPMLRDTILGVDGLSTLVVVHAPLSRVTKGHRSSLPHTTAASSGLFGPVSAETGLYGYGPRALAGGYDFPSMHSTTQKNYDGSSRAVGIVIDSQFLQSDVSAYLKYFKIKQAQPPQVVAIDAGAPPGSLVPEVALDTETISGTSPGAALKVYEIPSLANVYITDAYNKVVSDNQVDVLSSSFGGYEADLGRTPIVWNEIAKQALAKGMVFAASTGDDGGLPSPFSPASGPCFVAVGGTSLNIGPDGAWNSEFGWAGSGGGVSELFPSPAWQKGVANVNQRGRNTPDIAFDADPYTGAAIYLNGTWNNSDNPIGGTSYASPIFAGMVAQIDQLKGGRVGLSGASLYGALSAHGYGPNNKPFFHDITQGGSYEYFAVPGFDLVTGIGSVDAWNLASEL